MLISSHRIAGSLQKAIVACGHACIFRVHKSLDQQSHLKVSESQQGNECSAVDDEFGVPLTAEHSQTLPCWCLSQSRSVFHNSASLCISGMCLAQTHAHVIMRASAKTHFLMGSLGCAEALSDKVQQGKHGFV